MLDKRTFSDWLKVVVLLLDDAIVVVLIFLVLHFLNVRIPLSTTILVALLIAVLVFIIHIKVIPSFRLKQATGREGMIGLEGRVVQSLTPVGVICVKGENWKAKSVGDYIEVEEEVEVAGVEGLTLRVTRLQED